MLDTPLEIRQSLRGSAGSDRDGGAVKLKLENLWDTLEQLCVQTASVRKRTDDLLETLAHLRTTLVIDGLGPPEGPHGWDVTLTWPPVNE